MPKEFSCPTCCKVYESSGGLRKHLRKFATHKPEVKDNGPLPASKAVTMFLNVHDCHRKARLKELAKQLTEEEMQDIFLPKLSQYISLDHFATEKSRCSVRKERVSVVKLWTEIKQCMNTLRDKHPELEEQNTHNKGKLTSFIDDMHYQKTELTAPLILSKEHNKAVADYVVNTNDSKVLKTVIMPVVLENNYDKFVEFSTGLATNFNISQAKYQNILRNELGKELMDTLGVNIIVPKDAMVKEVHNMRKEIQETLQLKFIEKDGIVAAYTNVRQTIEWLLGKESLSSAISLPNDHIIIYHYADAFPWMQWSKFFTGETSIRIKLVEPHNLMSTIATICTWLGPDDYDHMSALGSDVFNQLDNLKEVYHPILKKPIKVSVRGVADGSQRRSATGNSSASSTYPIPEAPERSDQLGDMTIICQSPVWESTSNSQHNYNDWLGHKCDNQENRREFAKQNLGQNGRYNVTKTSLQDFYPGTMHLVIRATETITQRIGLVAESCGVSKKAWYQQVQKVARKVCYQKYLVTFDEAGALVFYDKCNELLKNAGFEGLIYMVLSDFCVNVGKVMQHVLHPPPTLTRNSYDCDARVLLGFQFVIIFGTETVTATIKQIVAYTGFYIDKALSEARLLGVPITLRNFYDGVMETKHKESKQGNFVYSGGQTGKNGKSEYQKRVLTQQYYHEWMGVEAKEKTGHVYSTDSKRKRKELKEETKTLTTPVSQTFTCLVILYIM